MAGRIPLVQNTGQVEQLQSGDAALIPFISGGVDAGSAIEYRSTLGVGTVGAIAHRFTGGNNGGTTIATLYNSGQTSFGNYASPTNLRAVTIGQDTAYMSFGSMVGLTSYGAIYFAQATPSSSNYALVGDATNTVINAATPTGLVGIYVNAAQRAVYARTYINFTPGVEAGSATTTSFSFTVPVHSNQIASVESPNFKITGASKTWAAGAITTQRWNYFTANTAAFASASTITDSYGLYVEAATAGSNATITNNFALGLLAGTNTIKMGNLTGDTTRSAIYLNQSTPNATNYVIASNGSGLQLNVAATTSNYQVTSAATSWFVLSPNNQQNAMYFVPPAASGSNQTASTEKQNVYFGAFTRTWNAGTITTQRFIHFTTQTAAFASASTITNAYGLYVESPTAGTNATITNNFSIGTSGHISIGGALMFSNNTAIDVSGGILRLAASAAYTSISALKSLTLVAGTATAGTAPLKFTSGTNLTAAENGAVEYDGVSFFITDSSLQRKTILGGIYTQTSNVTVANTVAETSLLTSTTTLPAGFFTLNKQLLINLIGYHSASGNPTVRIKVKLGSTVILDTTAVTSGGSTNAYFSIDALIDCRSTGVTGTVRGGGSYNELHGAGNLYGMVNTADVTIDTTVSQVLDVTLEWGTASVNNTLTTTNGYMFTT